MVKLFMQQLDLSSIPTTNRDLRSLEDQVNNFTRQGLVQPLRNHFQVVEASGVVYASMLLEYNITNN